MGCWLVACRPTDPEPEPQPLPAVEVLVSELYGDGWSAWRLPAEERLGQLHLSEAHPALCSGEGALCLNYQARGWQGASGEHQVVYTFTPMNTADGDDLGREDRHGVIAAVSWPALEPRWAVEALDFSGLSGGELHCTWSAADPCTPAEGLPDRAYHRCFLYQPHELALVEDDGGTVRLWVTDSRNARVLRLRVEVGQRCAQVEEVLGGEHPDWAEWSSPNALEHFTDTDGEHLLVSMKDSLEALGGGEGQGTLTQWTRQDGGDWALDWRHPPDGAWLNSPHGLTRAEGPAGERLLLFAHSAGLGEAWNLGPGGTLGVLALSEVGPEHLADLTVPGGLNYPRDVLAQPGGEVWLGDSGCKGGVTCERAAGLWGLVLDPGAPSGEDGAWPEVSPEEVAPKLGPLLSTTARLYSVELLEPPP